MDTCLLTKWWTAQRWHEFHTGIYMERGNPRTDDKGVYQVAEPQDKSTNAVMYKSQDNLTNLLQLSVLSFFRI